ncbi:ParB/RepB/Spo0J family partition protein [Brevibacterium aurantiacum]|uniref:ParB-like nuclease domain-containing protein n=1 Tax=Brevibacterium aurantiacum TaxID=273384 RepID=A0A2H1KS22_BREAU|nr:ParB/RepB/Spo0J family partition protein [Brevibacterium aurantiacum]SMY02517.1 ParB-like nuclease domain-containing protein [Brevibacterium aurantiacum]
MEAETFSIDTNSGTLAEIDPEDIRANPNNPRRYFNEERLDLLRTSIQEVGILVPLIVYQSPDNAELYILMDGERRWRCAVDLGMDVVPASIIPTPGPLDNLLRMFNIHNVREDWPLISVALSLREVMAISNENGEKRLSEMTGLTRSTVRRAKRLLSIPDSEIDLIQAEAHLDRSEQVHREDLYLEVEAAESVLRNELPEIMERYSRTQIIRAFAEKAEIGTLNAITDFRFVGKLVKAIDDDIVERHAVEKVATRLIEEPTLSPRAAFDSVASDGYLQQSLQRKSQVLSEDLLEAISSTTIISHVLRDNLLNLRNVINEALESHNE